MTDRIRGIEVYPMPEAVGGPAIYGTYALLIREDGEARMVHSEGVAYSVTDDKPWRWNDYLADCPEFTVAQLITLAVGPEPIAPVDLADWVRTFGARLESNFHQIVRWNSEAV
jgi:sugar/nucleoside kinase (ribokinase family)